MSKLNWYGLKFTCTDATSDKFWAIYLCETGQVCRQWGPTHAGITGGTFKKEKYPTPKEAFDVLSRLAADKISKGYSPESAAARFSMEEGAADVAVARGYRAIANGTAVDANPLQALRDLINDTVTTGDPVGESAPADLAAVVELPHKAEKSYLRPNGDKYIPRTINGMPDVPMLRTARDNNITVVFYGAPGCGKTALTEGAFPDCLTLVGSDATEVSDFVGGYQPDPDRPGSYIWIDGPLIEAMLSGLTLNVDEIALIDAQTLSVLYPLMDGRGEIRVASRPDSVGGPVVQATKGFYIVGAFNPYVPGARMSEALWSRFGLKIEYTTDYRLCKTMKVPRDAITASIKLNTLMRDPGHELTWAPQMRELLRYKDVAEVFGVGFAVANLVSEAPLECREVVEAVIKDVFSAPKLTALATDSK